MAEKLTVPAFFSKAGYIWTGPNRAHRFFEGHSASRPLRFGSLRRRVMSHCASARTLKILGAATFFMMLNADHVFAQGIPHLGPEDTAIAIDLDSVLVPAQNNGRYPATENPPKILDNLASTKYLNFGGVGSGFIVTPSSGSQKVESFQIRTANDAPGRDPASWALYGFNGALTTTDS